MHGAFVKVAMLCPVVSKGQAEIVLHERDVPLDRLLCHFDLLGELTTVWKSPPLNRLMDREDPFDRTAGVSGASG